MLINLQNITIRPKWYFSIALLFITVLGAVLGQQKSSLPNQEIVLQFADAEVSSHEAHHTISILEQQLQSIGIVDIQVSEQEEGKLVISYYSDTNVESIKKLLSDQEELAIGVVSSDKTKLPLPLPSKEDAFRYNLDVYEISTGQYSYADLGGSYAVEFKSGADRFLNPNFHVPVEGAAFVRNEAFFKAQVTPIHPIQVIRDYRSHEIPEVRAGPLSAERNAF